MPSSDVKVIGSSVRSQQQKVSFIIFRMTTFEPLDLLTYFFLIIQVGLTTISRSSSDVKVMGLNARSQQPKVSFSFPDVNF